MKTHAKGKGLEVSHFWKKGEAREERMGCQGKTRTAGV